MPQPITATIITLNEEANIREVIESAQTVCDEIIVVDSESTDKTVEIARSMGAKVYVQAYLGDGLQKDFGVQYATNDWILSIDADERLEPQMSEVINALDLAGTPHDAFAFRRKTFVGDRWQKIWYPDYVTRLYNKTKCRYLPVKGHAKVDAKNVKPLACDMVHYSYIDLSDVTIKIDKFSKRGATMLFAQGKRVSRFAPFTHGLASFIKEYFLKKGFLYGLDGLTITLVSSFSAYMKYAMLVEMQENEAKKKSKENA